MEMGQPIKLVGGFSLPGSITIISNEFVSRALYADGLVSVTVRRRSKNIKWMGFVGELGLWGILIVAILIWNIVRGIMAMVGGEFTLAPYSQEVLANIPRIMCYVGVVALIMLWTKMSVSAWHGAEHMTIGSYIATGKHNLRFADRFSPINKDCGGRFFVVLMIASLFCTLFLPALLTWVSSLLFLFAVLFMKWVDKSLCSNRLVAFLNHKLQEKLTTCQPDRKELETAHCALLGLLKVHGRSVELPPYMELEIGISRHSRA